MLGGVVTMMVAAGLLAAWKALPGLLDRAPAHRRGGRAGRRSAITYLIELRLRADPAALPGPRPEHRHRGYRRRAWHRPADRRLPRAVGDAAADLALPRVHRARGDRARRLARPRPRPARRTASEAEHQEASRLVRARSRLPVPAAAATLAAFAANGLFAGLSGLFLATTLAPVLARAVRSDAVPGVLRRSGGSAGHGRLPVPRARLGTISMLAGLVLLVVSVRLSAPEPRAVPDRRRADRRGRGGRLQRHHRDRARGNPRRKTASRMTSALLHRPLRRTFGPR